MGVMHGHGRRSGHDYLAPIFSDLSFVNRSPHHVLQPTSGLQKGWVFTIILGCSTVLPACMLVSVSPSGPHNSCGTGFKPHSSNLDVSCTPTAVSMFIQLLCSSLAKSHGIFLLPLAHAPWFLHYGPVCLPRHVAVHLEDACFV